MVHVSVPMCIITHFSIVSIGQSKQLWRTYRKPSLHALKYLQHNINTQTKWNIPEVSFGFDRHSGGIPSPSQTPCDYLFPMGNSILSATEPAVVPSQTPKPPEKINTIFNLSLLCLQSYSEIQKYSLTSLTQWLRILCARRLDFHSSSTVRLHKMLQSQCGLH